MPSGGLNHARESSSPDKTGFEEPEDTFAPLRRLVLNSMKRREFSRKPIPRALR